MPKAYRLTAGMVLSHSYGSMSVLASVTLIEGLARG
jgi:hypothetical protein